MGEVLIAASVKLIGARARSEVKQSPRLPELGGEVAALQRELLIASTDACDSSETRGLRALLSWPSKMMRNVLLGAPFTRMSFQPLMLAPGASWTKLSGLRTAPSQSRNSAGGY